MLELRSSILAETQRLTTKSRFGMFSIPPPLAIGDDSAFKQIHHPKGADGKPMTKPRNMLAGTNRSGVGKKGYFAVSDSIYQGDNYIDPFKVSVAYDKKMHSKSGMHETQFKPSSAYGTLVKSAYEYTEQKVRQSKKRKLDANGRVWTQPKNVTTNQTKTIERKFMKNPEFISDPFDRKKEQQLKQKKDWRSKLPEANWKFVASSLPTFNKDKVVYGLDDKAQSLISKKKQSSKMVLKTFSHETPFVPAKKVGGHPICKYPTAMSAQSLKILKSHSVSEKSSKKEQQAWKPNNGLTKSKPSPSISFNKKNMSFGRYK